MKSSSTTTDTSSAATTTSFLQSNRHFSHTLTTTARPEAIWKIWTDVHNWKQWDSGLRDAEIQGDFSTGNKGYIISLENRKSTFEITSVEPGKTYTFKTKLPMGALYIKRYLTAVENKTVFTHEVWFKGFSGKLFAHVFGAKFRKILPQVMQHLKQIAEKEIN
ncbi:SRPBCC family protein [Flavobacteriaceae bacterium M23B6Z8]